MSRLTVLIEIIHRSEDADLLDVDADIEAEIAPVKAPPMIERPWASRIGSVASGQACDIRWSNWNKLCVVVAVRRRARPSSVMR